jgi:hypothetical protein
MWVSLSVNNQASIECGLGARGRGKAQVTAGQRRVAPTVGRQQVLLPLLGSVVHLFGVEHPPQGRFAGQFFGMSDDWATLPDRTHHSEEEIRNTLLAGFDIEFWQEENRPTTNTDHPKYWHLFHVVACRRQANGKGS